MTLAVLARGTLRLWNLETGTELFLVRAHDNVVPGVVFAPNGKMLATSSLDGSVKVWDLQTLGQPSIVREKNGGRQAKAVGFNRNGKILAAAVDNHILLWNVEQQKELRILQGHEQEIYALCFSPTRTTLLASGGHDDENAVRLWDVGTGTPVGEPLRHHAGTNAVVFSPDGGTLASGGVDRTIWLWDVNTGKKREQLRVTLGR